MIRFNLTISIFNIARWSLLSLHNILMLLPLNMVHVLNLFVIKVIRFALNKTLALSTQVSCRLFRCLDIELNISFLLRYRISLVNCCFYGVSCAVTCCLLDLHALHGVGSATGSTSSLP